MMIIITQKTLQQTMTTDNEENRDFKSNYNVDKYIEDSILKKHQNKPDRMIRRVLEDGTILIGKNKYDALKKIPKKARLQKQQELIDIFENYHGINNYLKNAEKLKLESELKLKALEEKKANIIRNINKENVWKAFRRLYLDINGKKFIKNDDTIENIRPLILYFSKDEDFLNFGVKKDGVFLSQPSLEKGLCIIGGFGNGKTSIMNTFQKMFIGLDGYSFGRFSSHEIVRMYEDANKHKMPELVDNFWKLMTRTELYIDDVKAESEALSFGKRNLLNTIFQERYNKKLKTHISINYKSGHNYDPLQALYEFKTKYSNQVYDRIYEMYNIIEFKGKTFRR